MMITAMNQNLNTHTNGNLVMLMPAVLDNSVQYMNTHKQPQLQPYQPTMTAVPVPPPLTMGISSTSPIAASFYNAPESNFAAQRMSSHSAANNSHGSMRLEALFVGDLSYFCTDAHLQQLFEPYGPVHKAVVRKSKTQEPLHYGFVEVPVEKAHLAIQELNGLVFLGRKLRIGIYKTKMEDYHDQLISLHVSFLCRLTNFIVDEVFLTREFSRFGEVQDCVVKQHCSTPVSGSPRQYGYAFVYYADMASAQRALDALQQDSLMNHVKYACNLSHNEHHHQPNQNHNHHHQQHHNASHAPTTTPHPLQNINHFYHPGVHQPLPPVNNTNNGSTPVNSYSSHHPPSPPLLHIPSPTNANVSQSLNRSHSSHSSPPMTFQPLPNVPLPLPMSIPLPMPISYPYAPQGAAAAPDAPHYLYNNNNSNSNNNPTNNSNHTAVMNTYVQYPVGHAAPPSAMAPHYVSSAPQPAGNSPPLVPLMVPPPLPMHGAAPFQGSSAPHNMNNISHMNISLDPHRPHHLSSSYPANSVQFIPPPHTTQFQSYHH